MSTGGGISGGGTNGSTVIGDISAGIGSKIAPGNASTASIMQFSNNLSLAIIRPRRLSFRKMPAREMIKSMYQEIYRWLAQ